MAVLREAPESQALPVRLGHLEALPDLAKAALAIAPEDNQRGSAVAFALFRLRNSKAVPALVEIASAPNVRIRQSAVHALRNIRSRDAVAALARALDDPDVLVRYHGAMGLAWQTDRMNPKWTLAFRPFSADPKPLVAKWKRWWESTGESKYASIEDVIRRSRIAGSMSGPDLH